MFSDEYPFYKLLVQLVHLALLQREKDRIDEKDWVLNEAMSGRKLQNGGTFRNVLARRIDEVITPYFAEIIAHCDQNSNLDILDPKNMNSPISQLWLLMFKFTGGRIDFKSLVEGKTTIKTDFCCKFPFSWYVKDVVDALNADMQGECSILIRRFLVMVLGTERQLFRLLCEALDVNDVGIILGKVEEDNVEVLYDLYLCDFVCYIYKSNHKSALREIEHKVCILSEFDLLL